MPPEAPQAPSFSRPQAGTFTHSLYRQMLQELSEKGAVFTLSVSSGTEERVFFFTRGAILFLATDAEGGDVLARKIAEKGIFPREEVAALSSRARDSGVSLQELISKESILPKDEARKLVEETIAEHLLEIALWDGALFDLNPGNPPQKLYEKGVPVLRLSLGAKALIERVRPDVDQVSEALAQLGGSLRNFVSLATSGRAAGELAPEEKATLELIPEGQWRVKDLLIRGDEQGRSRLSVVRSLGALHKARAITLTVDSAALTREQELREAQQIEGKIDDFVSKLLASMHLAKIYAKVGDKEKAGSYYRNVGIEHLARDNRNDGLVALREAVKWKPLDLEARELVVKVLQSLDHVADAAKEAVELGKVLVSHGLPGRARQAFELSLKLMPGSTNALWLLGSLLKSLGFKDDAVKVYEELTDRAQSEGNDQAARAGAGELIALVPAHQNATVVLRTIASHRREFLLRYAIVAVSVVVLALSVGLGSYQMLALNAAQKGNEKVDLAIRERRFDEARAIAAALEQAYPHSHHKEIAKAWRERVEKEEAALKTHEVSRASRVARSLEDKAKMPEALEAWKKAIGAPDPALAGAVAEAIGRCQARVQDGQVALTEARGLVQKGLREQAHEKLARAFERSPWIQQTDLVVPNRLETWPHGAKVWLDGVELERTTPLDFDHSLTPAVLKLEASGHSPVELKLDALPPWPVKVLLPRQPAWRLEDVSTSSTPLLIADLVVTASRDRSLVAASKADGKVAWRAPLGVFGECSTPLAAAGPDVIVARLDQGALVAFDTKGKELWRKDVPPLPLDLPDPGASRIAVTPRGDIVVREGAHGLISFKKDGTQLWPVRLRGEVIGPPVVANDRVWLLVDGALASVRSQDGSAQPSVALPARPIAGPIVLASGAIALVLEGGQVALFDDKGSAVPPVAAASAPIVTPLATDGTRVFFGTAKNEVVSADPMASKAQERVLRFVTSEPVRWVRPVDLKLVLVGTESALLAASPRGTELWRHTASVAAPAVDERQVYAPSPSGLEALER